MQNLANIVSINAPVAAVESELGIVKEQLQQGRIALALGELFEHLAERREDEPENWAAYARGCRNDSITDLLHQDPFTYRAFAKPRGYAGDAVMMDYIYGLGEATAAGREATPLGRAILQYMGTRPSAHGVRYRRQLIASLIDRVAGKGGTSVLALAAGHLREVECSRAIRDGRIRNFVAFDQDEASLSVVARDYAHLGVQTLPGSVRQILARKVNPGQFDLVYAAGLFDYLNAPVATALTRLMFDMTRPGGLMLIPNFLPGVKDRGYMESFMDWHLIYRDHAEMEALALSLPHSDVTDYRIFDDKDDAITFLLVAKAS